MIFVELVFMLVVILIAAEIFTNALEHLGARLRISEGVTGSLFAAVGTAMPETTIPLLALLAGTGDQQLNEDIGVGAILGAPLMLSTLTLFLLLVTVIARRGPRGEFTPETSGITRDLNFFLVAFAIATLALFIPQGTPVVREALGIGLVLLYVFYILLTVRASSALVESGHSTEADRRMLLNYIRLPTNLATIGLQIVLGLGLLIGGAEGFIHGVELASELLGISPLLLSLLIVPIATELPEKINSILWIRRDRDTLAFGNVTGAMVFQGTLLPAIGITMTAWEPRHTVLAGVFITLAAATWIRLMLARGCLRVWHLAINGMLYAGYILIALQ